MCWPVGYLSILSIHVSISAYDITYGSIFQISGTDNRDRMEAMTEGKHDNGSFDRLMRCENLLHARQLTIARNYISQFILKKESRNLHKQNTYNYTRFIRYHKLVIREYTFLHQVTSIISITPTCYYWNSPLDQGNMEVHYA